MPWLQVLFLIVVVIVAYDLELYFFSYCCTFLAGMMSFAQIKQELKNKEQNRNTDKGTQR